jgi:hypothetical protein
MLSLTLLLLATPKALASAPTAPRVDYPGVVTPDDKWWELEVLYDQGEIEKGLARTKEFRQQFPDDPDLIWHQIRFMFEIGELVPRNSKTFDKIAWYQEMIALANRGLEIAPGQGHLLFARGIAVGRLGTTKGVLASLGTVKAIEADWQATAASGYKYSSIGGQEVLPCDAWLTLGIFYRLVPDWWIVQVMAGIRGDLHKSLEYAEKADQCTPNRIISTKELGVTQLCLGQKTHDPAMQALGMNTLARGLSIPTFNDKTDAVDIEHIKLLLAQPDLACAYSRDGQQDLDRAKLPADPAASK